MKVTILFVRWHEDSEWSVHSVHRNMSALCEFLGYAEWNYPPILSRGASLWEWDTKFNDRTISLRADQRKVRGA